jgi:hypothetical protein
VRKIPLIGAAILLIAAGVVRAQSPIDPEQASFAKLSGKELVQQLADDKKRPRAFYELLRRTEPGKYADFKTFEVTHYNSRLVVCPQEKPRPPIYLVLYGFLDQTETGSSDDYVVKKPSELFPPATSSPNGGAEKEPAIHGFTAEGRGVSPFDGNTVLTGTLADINGDEIIERVDSMTYGVEGIHNATVLTVSAVKMKAQPLLTVILNWEADEWTYRLTDRDGDGISDIEAGPRTAAGLIPKAVWKWDRAKHLYVGPRGKAGDHFRVINGAALWKELGRLKAARLTFPKDADAIAANDIRSEQTVAPTPTPPPGPTGPYHYTTLKGASDAELFRFMARGKSEYERQAENKIRNRLPENFLTMDAKAAALALVEANRTEAHRRRYQIAIEDRDKAQPPPSCTIAFSNSSARCYTAIDGHYFLRVDPEDSYLAFAESSSTGIVFYSAVYDQPAFDLRLCPLSYEDARKITGVIWWLDRVRSRDVSPDTHSNAVSSTADGRGRLVLRVDGRPVIDHAKTLWSDHLSGRWIDGYAPESFLNFASYLIADALPKRLGPAWSQFEPKDQQDIETRQNSAPVYTDEERKRLQDLSERFLAAFSPGQEKISFSIVTKAAQFAGNFGVASANPRLREIEAALPAPAPPKRSSEKVYAELEKVPYSYDVRDLKKAKEIEKRRAALESEYDAIRDEPISDDPDILRRTIDGSLREIAVATEADRLYALAISHSTEQQWALQRLALADRKRYADALEVWTNKAEGKWGRQFFAELARVDRERAVTIARQLSPDNIGPLTIPAFRLMQDAGTVPDEAQHLATIIKMLHNPKTEWDERSHAIQALVPESDPPRYPGREIDEALLKLFEPGQADENGTFTQEEACLALARRGRIETFDIIEHQLEATQDAGSYGRVLQALTHLAQRSPTRFNARLVTIVRPHLSNTNKSVPGLIWTIWSADLRELEDDLKRLATRSSDEFEDYKASSYGGSASAVTGRFHLARKVLNLWSEPDPLMRARLLVAFGTTEAEELFRNPMPERLARLKTDMNRAAGELSGGGKDALRAFVRTIDSDPNIVDDGRVDPQMVRKVTAFARQELHL